jgi:hypothetical protein
MQPLLIFHHLPKTAGTSLYALVRANYGRQCVQLPAPIDADQHWYRDYYDSLAPDERDSLRCLVGHRANWIIPALDRPFRCVSLLRDPVERVISLYFFQCRQASERWRRPQALDEFEQVGRLILERGWSIHDIYNNLGPGHSGESPLHHLFRDYFNGQSRSILDPYCDTSELGYERNAGLQERRLQTLLQNVVAESYIAGTQEFFPQSVALMGAALRWRRRFVVELNVNDARPRGAAVDDETRAIIHAHNWLDAELHGQRADAVSQASLAGLQPTPARFRWRRGAASRLPHSLRRSSRRVSTVRTVARAGLQRVPRGHRFRGELRRRS